MSAKNLLLLRLLSAAAAAVLPASPYCSSSSSYSSFVCGQWTARKRNPKVQSERDSRDIRLLHSRCAAASYIKTQKKPKKTWRTSLRDSGQWEGGVGVKTEHCGGWRCINFSNLSALRRMNFSSFLNNFCLRVFVLFFFLFPPLPILCHVVISFSFGQQSFVFFS